MADPEIQSPDEWLESLQEEARRCLQEIVASGQAVLADGKIVKIGEPGIGDMIRVWQWLVNLKPPKKTSVPLPEDFTLKQTQKEKPSGT